MNLTRKSIACFLFAVTIIGVSSAAAFDTDFEGTWRGQLQQIDPPLHYAALPDVSELPESLEFAIEFSENTARVYILWEDTWQEVKPGLFGSITHKTNAIVAAIDSSFSEDGRAGWVETWNFTLTSKDDESLYAYWVRAVNNPHLSDGSHPDARGILSRFGTLQRSDAILGVGALSVSTTTHSIECRQTDIVCGNSPNPINDNSISDSKIDQRN